MDLQGIFMAPPQNNSAVKSYVKVRVFCLLSVCAPTPLSHNESMSSCTSNKVWTASYKFCAMRLEKCIPLTKP
eukprot:1729587-Amphidinium_carterae.1